MNRTQFLDLMQSPEKLNGGSVAMLADVVRQFPYCQTAQLLYLKNLHIHKSIHYNEQLKIAAAYSSDRKKLYELIIQPGITSKIHEIEGGIPVVSEAEPFEHSGLEMEILKEAVNASIQLEVAKKDESEVAPQTKIQKDITLYKHTFSDWLKIVNKEKKEGAQSRYKLIDAFIKESKSHPMVKREESRPSPAEGLWPAGRGGAEFFSPVNTARLSVIEDENFVTETLAKIYVKQKNYSKAIKAYEILSLQNPEISITFAARIKSIRELMTNK